MQININSPKGRSHIVGPIMFWKYPQNNSILQLTFSSQHNSTEKWLMELQYGMHVLVLRSFFKYIYLVPQLLVDVFYRTRECLKNNMFAAKRNQPVIIWHTKFKRLRGNVIIFTLKDFQQIGCYFLPIAPEFFCCSGVSLSLLAVKL